MRIISTILVSVMILGGLGLYMQLRPEPKPSVSFTLSEAKGTFSLEVLLTFDAGPDPFAIDSDAPPSLEIQFEGNTWLHRSDSIEAGSVIVVEDVQGIKTGLNEIYLSASPTDTDYDRVRGVRVRLLRNQTVIAEESLWSEPGHLVEGSMLFDIDL